MSVRLVLVLFLSQFFRAATPICSVSKYPEGIGKWVKCSNATIDEARGGGGDAVVTAITISRSRIENIPANSFARHGKSLESLNLHYCGIRLIDPNAFTGLTYLKKLNLANNNVTTVEPGWFTGLRSLEQLDLSFNSIERIDSTIYGKLTNLRRFNLDENRLNCLEPQDMERMGSLVKFRLTANPLSLACRAKVTLWLNDKGINYSDALRSDSGSWLDRVLWLCAENEDYASTETQMRQCLLLNLFNQLRLALKTSESYPISAQQCKRESKMLTTCISRSGRGSAKITNGEAATNILLALQNAQQKFLQLRGH